MKECIWLSDQNYEPTSVSQQLQQQIDPLVLAAAASILQRRNELDSHGASVFY
jgi:hypothetical protein